jgi:UDP-3-O-[3-hydroxymyristoyl] glucosamine N-acyltransferase
VVSGSPSIPHRRWLKVANMMTQLPDMKKQLRDVEKRLKRLEED